MRRLRDALLLNAGAALGYHTLVLACRYVEARCQRHRETPDTAWQVDVLCGHCPEPWQAASG